MEKVDALLEKSLEKVCASVCSILIFSYGHGTIELKEGQCHEYETSENELDILNIFRKLDDAENNIREEKVFEAQTSLAVLRAKHGI